MREQETVKGVARRVVIVRSPAESVFEEAIFIVREEAERSGGVSREEVLSEARGLGRRNGEARAVLGAVSPPRRRIGWKTWAFLGTCAAALALALVIILI